MRLKLVKTPGQKGIHTSRLTSFSFSRSNTALVVKRLSRLFITSGFNQRRTLERLSTAQTSIGDKCEHVSSGVLFHVPRAT